MTCPDELLVARARARDAAAFQHLVGRHAPKLRRLVSRMLANPEDQEEVLQNVLLSAWCHLPAFEGRAQFSSWMYRVTSNAALMLIRDQGRRPCTAVGDVAEWERTQADADVNPVCGGNSCWIYRPDEAMRRTELRELLQRKVTELPPILRDVFILRHVDGLSSKAAAAMLRVSEATVKTRLHRACGALRAAIHRAHADVAVCRGEGSGKTESGRGRRSA